MLKTVNENNLSKNDTGGPTEVFNLLMVNSEFRLRFNDVVQQLMYNGGLLTPASAAAAYQARAAEVARALVGESARWGDSRTDSSDPVGAGNPYLLSDWVARNNDLYANYFPQRTGIVLMQFAAKTWATTLRPATFTNYGGTVAQGTQVTIAKPAGSPASGIVYYTLDGNDPRAVGGGVAPGAIQAPAGSTILTMNASTRVRARILDVNQSGTNNDWSAEIDATFLLDTPFPLRITELNYNPAPRPDLPDASNLLEFIELTNTGSGPISLNGVQIAGFADNPFVLPNGLALAAGERIVVARNPTEFRSIYGTGFQLVTTGYANANLSNGGEPVVLLGPFGETLQSFTFDDSAPWPTAPDGSGKSLVIIDPLGNPGDGTNWRASYYDGGSPGRDDLPIPGDYLTDGVVNQADYAAWKCAFGDAATLAGHGADGNGDGIVDIADYVVWRNNEGAMYVVPGAGSGAVSPLLTAGEPTTSGGGRASAMISTAALDAAFIQESAIRTPTPLAKSKRGEIAAHARYVDDLLLVTLVVDRAGNKFFDDDHFVLSNDEVEVEADLTELILTREL